MISVDIRTALLIIGLLYLILPTLTWVFLTGKHTRQVALWCGGGLLAGGGIILIGFRDFVPKWSSLYLATLMLLCSHLARIQSLRLDLRIPIRFRWIVATVAVIFLTFLGIQLGLKDAELRVLFNSSVGAGLLSYLALLAWRIGREEQSRSAKWIAWVYLLVAMAWLFRAYSVHDTGGNVNVLNLGLSSQLLVLASLLSSVIGHFGYIGLALDRSMRRELKATAERARDEENFRLSQQIAQLDRQRSLGQMSASLGHELNQPLTAILTNAQVARRGLKTAHFDSEQHAGFLDKIVLNTQRATQIIERIRGYIRPSSSRREPVDLMQISREIADLVADEARSNKVVFFFPENPGRIMVSGDPVQLSQIVLNVFRNAIEALAQVDRRKIHVTCHLDGEHAILRIRDTGPGLTPEMLATIGKPFVTTKPNGMGMGFSISSNIAVQHGGKLSIANASGGGAQIELRLPALLEATP